MKEFLKAYKAWIAAIVASVSVFGFGWVGKTQLDLTYVNAADFEQYIKAQQQQLQRIELNQLRRDIWELERRPEKQRSEFEQRQLSDMKTRLDELERSLGIKR